MNKSMKVWQWLFATSVAAITSTVGVLTFASDYINKSIDDALQTPMLLIDKVDKRLDRIEDKIDSILKGK